MLPPTDFKVFDKAPKPPKADKPEKGESTKVRKKDKK
jgi:hypothetical protein